MNKELVLVTISGPDHPGITAALMNCICKSKARIEDMGQSITHGLLSLSILLNMTKAEGEQDNSPLIKDLLFTAKKMGVELDFEIIEDKEMIKAPGDKYILSCVSLGGITSDFIYDISKTLADNNINIQRIENVTENEFKSLEIGTRAESQDVQWEQVKEQLINLSNKHETDLALLKDDVWRRNKRLIVFDMDSTLIQSEVIVEMAKAHGVGDKVHEITERAMEGHLNFDESLVERVRLLKGLREDLLQEIVEEIKLTEGVEDFVKTVKALGYKVAIISGGFTYFANYFKERLGIDYAFANDLHIENGVLTGDIKGSIVNAEKKAMLVDLLAQQEGIRLEQVVAIGDGANDLHMLAKAGLGIAFHAKEIVKQSAKQHMSHGPMTSILYFLGIPGAQD
ncbi:MAG: phosphoserine phosphatase SerB [Halobacteriovoraceae bacterium]|nr:phosphoserine phosphatase SerB [Halobacteriovoraceae bacterium]|tara:strand:- start:13916 stop:15106 length:1191 start_codon:yes stop_codon:yes gene_type:complete